jgi:hypothetical protein
MAEMAEVRLCCRLKPIAIKYLHDPQSRSIGDDRLEFGFDTFYTFKLVTTMSSYLYELPTTGAISFSSFYSDPEGSYISFIAQATECRATLRSCLKETKRFDDSEKDYLRLVKV